MTTITSPEPAHETPDRPENPYAKTYAAFLDQTKNHQLTVLHEDGLYRHLRVQEPGTRMWSWDITTWPGHLATSGDIADGFMFTREPDMVEFFASAGKSDDYYSDGSPSIDFRYWAEKLCGGRSGDVKEHSREQFMQHVKDVLSEHEDLGDEAQTEHEKQHALLRKIYELRGLDEHDLKSALEAYLSSMQKAARSAALGAYTLGRSSRDIAAEALGTLWSTEGLSDAQIDELAEQHSWNEIGDTHIAQESPAERRAEIVQDAEWVAGSEDLARQWLQNNAAHFGEDTWEWEFRDYDIHFLFTCYCIDLAVRLYRKHTEQHDVNDTYVHVRDGRVQNRPSQPVVDVSFLDYGVPDKEEAREALAAREQIMAVPQARKELPETILELTELVQEHGDQETLSRLDAALAAEQEAAERREREEALRQERILRSQEQQAEQARLHAERAKRSDT